MSLVSVYRGVLLYGDSGSGKSSLVNAGLIPETLARDFAPERLRVQPRVGEELVLEGIATAEGAHDVLSIEQFEAHVYAACQERRPLLIFDQFEELVTLFDAPELREPQQRLVELFIRLLHGSLPVKVLFSFREDYLGTVKELLAACPELIDQALRIAAPAADALPTIIRGPFERYPDHFERELSPALAERLVTVLGERFRTGELGLSEVQTVCLRLWQSTDPESLLDARGPQGLLEDYLGEALDEMPDRLRAAAIGLLGQMVTSAGTRNVIAADDLLERAREEDDDETPEELADALDRLSRSRLVNRERRRDLDLYEITSEFLVPWISRRRAELRESQARRQERRRLLILGSIALALLLIAAVVTALAIWAVAQRNRARDEATTATSLALASDAQANVASRLDVGLLLSLAALEPYQAGTDSPTIARSSMTAALQTAELQGLAGILHAGGSPVLGVAFTPEGRRLATANYDSTVRLWDPATRKQLAALPTTPATPVARVAFSPDGRTLAAGSFDGSVRLWYADTHRLLGAPLRAAAPVTGVAFSPDGRTLAVAGGDGKVRFWATDTRQPVGSPLTAGGFIRSLALGADGRLLVTGGDGGATRLWVRTRGRWRAVPLNAGRAGIGAVAVTPDGLTVAAGGDNGKVRLWDTKRRRPIGSPLPTGAKIVATVAFSPDGRILAAGTSDGEVHLWDRATRRPLRSPPGGITSTVEGLAFSPDGRMLAAGSYDGLVRMWDLDALAQPGSSLHVGPNLYGVAFSRDGRTLASGADDVQMWDPATRRRRASPPTRDAGPFNSVAFSRDDRLAAGGDDGSIWLWDGRASGPLRPGGRSVYGVAFSPDGRTLATVGDEHAVRLWDVADRKPVGQPLTTESGANYSVAISPDGRTLAAGGDDGRVSLWDLSTHRSSGALLTTNDIPVNGVAFSPDGRTLAAGSYDGGVRLWDRGTRKLLGLLPTGSSKSVNGVAFSPHGRTLAAALEDGRVLMWDTATREPLGTPLRANDQPVETVAFSPDGNTLAAAGDDGTVHLWSGFSWRDFAGLRARVCRLVGDDLGRAEWAQHAPAIDYRDTCP